MVFASRSNLCLRTASAENCEGKIFMATVRPSRVSCPRYTSPMPPAPRGETISNGPSLLPGTRGIRGAIIALAWIIHDFAGEKRRDALKGVMNTGFWRTRHSLSEHPRDDILLYTTAVLFLLPTPNHSS